MQLRIVIDSGRRTLAFLAGPGRTWALVATSASLPLLLFGGWVGYVAAVEARVATSRNAAAAVDGVAGRITAELAAQRNLVRMLAASTTLDAPDLGSFRKEVERAWADLPLWGTVTLAAPSGEQLLTLVRPGGDPPDPAAERLALEQVATKRDVVVGGIGPAGPASGQRRVTLRAPVFHGDRVALVISVALVPDGIAALLQRAGVPGDWVGVVMDGASRIVARIPGSAADQGQLADPALRLAVAAAPEGVMRGVTRDGVPVEMVYRTLPAAEGWVVAFGIPLKALQGPVHRALTLLAGEGLVSMLLAALLTVLVVRDLTERRADEADRARRSLRASEDGRTLAVEAADLGVWQWRVSEDVFDGSPRSLELLGVTAPESGARQISWTAATASVAAADRSALAHAVQRCLRDGDSMDGEFGIGAGKSPRWVRITGRTLDGGPGQPDLLHGVVADVTGRRRAEADRLGLLRHMAMAQEDERRRIAQELHDQVGQTVTGLSLGLKTLETTLAGSAASPAVRERLTWLQKLAAGIGQDIHRAAVDLRPAALDDFGLPSALTTLAATVTERHGLVVDVQISGVVERVPPDVEMVLYRVTQEALTNMVKHARARIASVLLERRARSIELIVEDDGIGFDLTDGSDDWRLRLGLSGMRERLRLVNGSLQIETVPGAGTTLFIHIPMSPGEQA